MRIIDFKYDLFFKSLHKHNLLIITAKQFIYDRFPDLLEEEISKCLDYAGIYNFANENYLSEGVTYMDKFVKRMKEYYNLIKGIEDDDE